ncbi:unnamed protein product [Lactuca saligna]|uniref:3-deoxy-8-phosphooctulonate synthase n=1 Tax=Lactuca saligna TaxID=75948 RepID=A0AA35Z0V3_LACSI|nr:unnamed protein product [Lactuca saligna]
MPRDDNCLDVSNHFLSVVSHYRGWCYAFSLLIDSYAFCNQGSELMEMVIGVYDSSHSKHRSDLGLEVGGSWSDWKYRKLGNENGRGTRFEYHSLLLNIIEFEEEKKGLITKLQVEEKICLVPDKYLKVTLLYPKYIFNLHFILTPSSASLSLIVPLYSSLLLSPPTSLLAFTLHRPFLLAATSIAPRYHLCRCTLLGHVYAGFGVELSSWFNSCESAARKISFFFTETFSGQYRKETKDMTGKGFLTSIKLNDSLLQPLQRAQPFFVLAGPNVIESEEHILHMAKQIKAITSKLGLPLVFKSSFDKANKTSSKSFRGPSK